MTIKTRIVVNAISSVDGKPVNSYQMSLNPLTAPTGILSVGFVAGVPLMLGADGTLVLGADHPNVSRDTMPKLVEAFVAILPNDRIYDGMVDAQSDEVRRPNGSSLGAMFAPPGDINVSFFSESGGQVIFKKVGKDWCVFDTSSNSHRLVCIDLKKIGVAASFHTKAGMRFEIAGDDVTTYELIFNGEDLRLEVASCQTELGNNTLTSFCLDVNHKFLNILKLGDIVEPPKQPHQFLERG